MTYRVLCAVLVAVCLSVTVFAAVTGTLVLDQSAPHVGDLVTFSASVQGLDALNTKGGTATPAYYASTILACSQQGTEVLFLVGSHTGDYTIVDGTFSATYQLDWPNGGAASCVATLFVDRLGRTNLGKDPTINQGNTLATVAFDVLP